VNERFQVHTIVVVSAVLLAATACGGGGTPTPARTAPPPSASANQINPMARDRVQDGGTFTWPLDQMPANFNYYELDGTVLDGAFVQGGLLPSVYLTDATGRPLWDKDFLASEPSLATTPKQVVTYEINPKAVWYDGTPVTWEDFLWQWKASNGTDKAYQISSATGYEDIESVQKGKNPREVVVTFKRNFADWQSLFNPFYPASTNKSPKTFNEGWRDTVLTTAGPFKLDSIDRTAKTITLVRNDRWWGDRAKLDRMVFRVMEPDAQIDAMANGEIDAMDLGPDVNKYNRAKRIENVEIRVAGSPNFSHLTLNGTSPNLQDVRVRQAVAMGIDRSVIARAVLGPLGIDAKPLNNHIYMANQDGYQDNAGEIGTYNPDRAKQLLDEVGWKLEGDVRRKGGQPLRLNCVIPTGVATARQIAELVQNMLGRVGISLQISAVPVQDLFEKYVTPGQFDITTFAWFGTAFPISSSKSIYGQPRRNDKGELDVKQNYARIGSDELDRLFDQANQELDRRKAIELGNRIDALIWQEVHSLPLYQRPELVPTKKTVANFGAFGFAGPASSFWTYQDIGWVKP
jgi:peptide/nickel transport system substrate-binding protein